MKETHATVAGPCPWRAARALSECATSVRVDTLEFTYEELADVQPLPNVHARRLRAHTEMCVSTSVGEAYAALNRLIAAGGFGATEVRIERDTDGAEDLCLAVAALPDATAIDVERAVFVVSVLHDSQHAPTRLLEDGRVRIRSLVMTPVHIGSEKLLSMWVAAGRASVVEVAHQWHDLLRAAGDGATWEYEGFCTDEHGEPTLRVMGAAVKPMPRSKNFLVVTNRL